MTISVIVDDTDPRIEYAGVWSETGPQAVLVNATSIAKSLGNTLHIPDVGPNGFAALTYNFTGSQISMFAVITPEVVANEITPYTWQCFVDKTPVAPVALEKLEVPTTIQICLATNLNDGPHMFEFIFTQSELDVVEIWFDYLAYLPSASTTSRTYDFIAVGVDDSRIADSAMWTDSIVSPDVTFGKQTSRVNSSFEFNFTGSSLVWFGYVANGTNARASYSIDNQPDIVFPLPVFMPNATANPNHNPEEGKVLFQSAQLDPTAPHTLNIVYLGTPDGTDGGAPLSLQSIVIGNGTVPASSTNATNSATSSSLSPTSTIAAKGATTPKSHKIGPIIGGVLAGILLVAILASLLIWRRRRSKLLLRFPFVIPHSSHPSTQGLMNYPDLTEPDLKGQRMLLPPASGPLVVPPSNLSTPAVSSQLDPIGAPQREPGSATNNLPYPSPRRVIAHIREEDSGLRMVEQSSEEAEVVVLPPVYTAV